MNQLIALLSRAASNKHTTSAAGIYFVAKAIAEFGPIWFPSHAEQFNKSLPIVEGLAVSYGLYMAGDAQKSAPATTKEESAANPENTKQDK